MNNMNSYFIILVLHWIDSGSPVELFGNQIVIGDSLHNDVVKILNTKDYIPNNNDLPKSSILTNVDNDATYILSKLSDEELIKLLNQQPKKSDYTLNDVLKIVANINKNVELHNDDKLVTESGKPQKALFRLEDKEVEPYNTNDDIDLKHKAVQKLNNILYSRPQYQKSEEEDEKKEMLFNVLVAQLKALCCKKPRTKFGNKSNQLKDLLKQLITQKAQKKSVQEKFTTAQNIDYTKEHIFLIINDEIKSNTSDELIAVDPETLSKNSSVLLLGPITTSLSDIQLKLVMSRITNELSKPEYLPLLQKISEGALNHNLGLMKSLITGPNSRRYIKAHRCNHQSKLARIYGGPKWLICTGYMNLNTPSLYD